VVKVGELLYYFWVTNKCYLGSPEKSHWRQVKPQSGDILVKYVVIKITQAPSGRHFKTHINQNKVMSPRRGFKKINNIQIYQNVVPTALFTVVSIKFHSY
jgi:hypothetical protein